MKKEVIILGDIEIGAGTLTDDFVSDEALSKLIRALSKRERPVDLILNGDTFDFLKCPYIVEGKSTYPRYITPEISVTKLGSMYKAHRRVFDALSLFVSNPKHKLYFLVGNHDYDLVYRRVKREIANILQPKGNLFFGMHYRKHGIYVEHGHQYDLLNRANYKNLFLNYEGKKILNLPWASFGLIDRFMGIKEDHPFLERIHPRPILLTHHQAVNKKITIAAIKYFLNSVFYYPFRYYADPTYTFSREILHELYLRFKKVGSEIGNIIDPFIKRRKRSISNFKIVVLGHIHETKVEYRRGKAIVNPGSWRDEYDLDADTKELIPRGKRFVHIKIQDDDSFEWNLREFPLKRNNLNFDKVIKNEMSFLHLVAKEENFKVMK